MCKRTLMLAALLLLCGCPKDESDSKPSRAEQARIEKEVATRVAVAKEEMKVEKSRLKTIRLVGFILLAGGALCGLVWLQRNHSYFPPQPQERHLQMPSWRDYWAIPSTRVLDLPQPAQRAPLDARVEGETEPPRRRAPRRRHRHHSRNRRNQDDNETPNDR